jgi:heme exporter protein D
MDMIRAYLAMGGYAAFVWPAFTLSAVVLIAVLATSLCGLRRSEKALADMKTADTADDERTA